MGMVLSRTNSRLQKSIKPPLEATQWKFQAPSSYHSLEKSRFIEFENLNHALLLFPDNEVQQEILISADFGSNLRTVWLYEMIMFKLLTECKMSS